MAMANGTRALVVTGDKRWRDHCVSTLINEGCEVDTASKGAQAFELCRKIPFDLIVVDESLPDYGPIETVLTLRDMFQHQPAVFVGGDNLERFHNFWKRAQVTFAGEKARVPDQVMSELSAS